ncbi:hypothetical protein EJB05_00478 [Eragrostis curvula]|uniref:Uncharacterized protein n=1 Tax=Eragrostis curvula TaxID=38414 RepID=A0A5J9WP61_9POAL|nr:hypothetical protein EJB05_00478 [Eragrostis curvula]
MPPIALIHIADALTTNQVKSHHHSLHHHHHRNLQLTTKGTMTMGTLNLGDSPTTVHGTRFPMKTWLLFHFYRSLSHFKFPKACQD